MAEAGCGSDAVLENAVLRVRVDPDVGGTITTIRHLGAGAAVLGVMPWYVPAQPHEGIAAPDERSWLAHYRGGWPLLFPNGGDACSFEGATHGFHGEASIAPWVCTREGETLCLERGFFSVPVTMVRRLSLEDDVLVISETVHHTGDRASRVMWTHHPTLGSDLLDGPFEITTGARTVASDEAYDPPANPLTPGVSGDWPILAGKEGDCDLSRLDGKIAAMAYLHGFDEPWVAVRRTDNTIAAALSWDAGHFPCAWLWWELGGTDDAPWFGRARLLGVEPSTSWPGTGLADIARRGGPLLTLEPGQTITTQLRLHVFQPAGPIRGIDAAGRATCDLEHA